MKRCRNAREVLSHIQDRQSHGAICEISSRNAPSPDFINSVVSEIGIRPVVFHTDVSPLIAGEVIRLAIESEQSYVSLLGFGHLPIALKWLTQERPNTPADRVILRRLTRGADRRMQAVLLAAVAAARSRTSVPRFAHLSGTSVRTLQERFRRAGWPTPADLLNWLTCLHAIWRLETTGDTIKQTACIMGFGDDSAAFSNYVLRQTGQRPQALLRAGGFWALLEQFNAQLHRVNKIPVPRGLSIRAIHKETALIE